MPSNSLSHWQSVRSAALDEIAVAHVRVGGTAPGRRHATQQLNRAYAVLLCSEFQGYCRDLYSECADQVIAAVPSTMRATIRSQLYWGRPFGRGNPHASAIGSEFGRFYIRFWDEVFALDPQHHRRRTLLDELVDWRNAIAHNDFDPARYGPNPMLHLHQVRSWRSALNVLAGSFDVVMRTRLIRVIGTSPWPP
jgi:hypothetical protein